MGVYIKGMEMPRKCIRCPVNVYGRCLVNDDKDVSKATADAVRDKDCPLIPVQSHGRLIDADALREDWLENGENEYVYDTNAFLDSLDDTPTIIPAEEGE